MTRKHIVTGSIVLAIALFVVLGAAIIQPYHGVVAKLLALPTFIAGIAATRIYERALVRNGLNVAPRLKLA